MSRPGWVLYLDQEAIDCGLGQGKAALAGLHRSRVPGLDTDGFRPWDDFSAVTIPRLPARLRVELAAEGMKRPPHSAAHELCKAISFAPPTDQQTVLDIDVPPSGKVVSLDGWFVSEYGSFPQWVTMSESAGVATLRLDRALVSNETPKWSELFLPTFTAGLVRSPNLSILLRQANADGRIQLGVMGHLMPLSETALELMPLAIWYSIPWLSEPAPKTRGSRA